MIFQEITNVFKEIRHTYNTEEFDFTKTHWMPLFFIEGAGIGAVADVETFERVFDSIINCNKYLDLLKIEFHVRQLMEVSESVVVAVVVWDFFNAKNKVGLVHEVGYVLQKRDNIWKINAVLCPTWRDPEQNRGDIKKYSSDSAEGGRVDRLNKFVFDQRERRLQEFQNGGKANGG